LDVVGSLFQMVKHLDVVVGSTVGFMLVKNLDVVDVVYWFGGTLECGLVV
jgi:hypothetical protein